MGAVNLGEPLPQTVSCCEAIEWSQWLAARNLQHAALMLLYRTAVAQLQQIGATTIQVPRGPQKMFFGIDASRFDEVFTEGNDLWRLSS